MDLNSVELKVPTPRQLGYYMPAEWERHTATWLSWPRPEGISFPGAFEEASAAWAKLVSVLSDHEQVHINVFDEMHKELVVKELERFGLVSKLHRTIFLHQIPAYEPWIRDHGPIFLKKNPAYGKSQLAIVDWGYNAWGGKYPPYDLDDQVPKRISELLDLPLFQPEIVLEGGAFDVNGSGDLLTTCSCLLNPNRNPELEQRQIETYLREFLGVERIHWLGEGIEGDDTDGHVDDICRFVAEDVIVTVLEDDSTDPNYAPLMENYERLLHLRGAHGKFRVVTLPMPPRVEREGIRLPASYANFYIANDVVIVPVFRAPSDREALLTLSELFASRKIFPFDATDLIWGLGAVHCITQQQPAV